MNKLFPIANKETRHLFVDPAIARPSFISGEGYVSGEMTSFIKPGKVPNLALLCQPEGEKFTVTEEPNMDTIAIKDILFGAYDHQGIWTVCLVRDLNSLLFKDGPARAGFKSILAINPAIHQITNGVFSEETVDLGNKPTLVPIDILYERGTRALTLREVEGAGIDSGIPQILGIKLNLDWIDSKIVK